MASKTTKTLVVSRREMKYPVNFAQYASLSELLQNMLIEDKNNGMEGYKVRSLYFDTHINTDFYQKLDGDEERKKIRIRTYDCDAQNMKLELKRKQGDYQKKTSVLISREDANQIIKRNYDVLLKYDSSAVEEIYNIMKVNCLRPVVMIEYKRKAYIHPINKIRLTLDSEIFSSEMDYDIFSKKPAFFPVNDEYYSVLEVKYDGFLFGWIEEMLRNYGLNRESYSKYYNSRFLFENYLA